MNRSIEMLEASSGDQHHVAWAVDLEGESKLFEAGFEFMRQSGKDDMAIYRKRK